MVEIPLIGGIIRYYLLYKNGHLAYKVKEHRCETLSYPGPAAGSLEPPLQLTTVKVSRQKEANSLVRASDTIVPLVNALIQSSVVDIEQERSLILKYHQMYQSGEKSVIEVVEAFFSAIDEGLRMKPQMLFLAQSHRKEVMEQARLSEGRYRRGAPISILDGVLFAVKDEFDVKGYNSSLGTCFLSSIRETRGTVPSIQALLDAGAIMVGKTLMQEIGLGTSGINPVQGTPRNPCNPEYMTGGSSSGTAAIVAAGLVTFAIGGDGGGSIRIPSSLCGVVGLKPTNGRLSASPSLHIVDSVGTLGPICRTVVDCKIVYAIMASTPGDSMVHGCLGASNDVVVPTMPRGFLSSPESLVGFKIGIYKKWFDHCDYDVRAACEAMVGRLVHLGAQVQEIEIDFLNELSMAHSITIGSEMLSTMASYRSSMKYRYRFNLETQMSMFAVEGFSSSMYVSAQRTRRKVHDSVQRAFQQCHFILTPTVPCVAPRLPKNLKYGLSDLGTTMLLMRFCQLANMIGLPAATIPIECNSSHLPIGLQIMAPQGEEATVLHVASIIESAAQFGTRYHPQVFWKL